MARTKASVGAKISSGKSSKARCTVASTPSSSGTSGNGERSSRGSAGGNPVCQRETPKWQRPITNFFMCNDASENSNDEASAGTSNRKSKRNVIESDDEETPTQEEKPKNTELDETIELETLSGENSHKIDEYYPKNDVKGKGIGKKTNKENIDANVGRRKSVKRDLEEIAFGEEDERATKKVKVN